MTFPWELAPAKYRGTNPELAKDPVTGLWPGQQTPDDVPDFLRVVVPEGTIYYDNTAQALRTVASPSNNLPK